jgi:large subunit ribosomal protein L30
MVTKVNDYVAFGEPSAGVLATLLRRRAEPLAGDADVDDDWIDANTAYVDDDWIDANPAYVDADALAEALLDEETTLRDAGLSPSLRLHPPRGGHDGVKRAVVEGGELGRHDTEAMDALLEAMR